MPSLCATFLVLVGALSTLGPELRRDGYLIRPPAEFRMTQMELFDRSRVGAVGTNQGANGKLSAALVDKGDESAAAYLIATVEGSLQASPGEREAFTRAVVHHLEVDLGLAFSLERSELVHSGAPRIEVLGSVRQEGQLRYLLVAAVEGEGRHAVVTLSVPSGRWEELSGALRASLDSFRWESRQQAVSAPVAVAGAALLLAGLAASFYARRRRGMRSED